MLLLWLIHLRTGNAAIVDVGWAGGLAVLGILYSGLAAATSRARAMVGGMAGIWGLRLGLHLLTRASSGIRKKAAIRSYGAVENQYPFQISPLFEFQALLCVVLAVPFLLATRNPEP